jgi:hypothetical protein
LRINRKLFETPISAKQSEGDQVVLVDSTIANFRITDRRLFANRGLLGRGTIVLPVQRIDEKKEMLEVLTSFSRSYGRTTSGREKRT